MSRPPAAAVSESLLAFWAEAGVDAALLETAVDRIAEGQRPLAPRAAPAAAPLRPPTAAPPARQPQAIEAAREVARSCSDLVSLAAAIEVFEGCPIRFEGAASRAVFSRGPADAPVVVIGEAPGAEEDRAGHPFVGKAGRMLDRMLEAIGLTDRVFITNTVFWRPPGNRTPTAEEQLVCKPFVEQAIRLVRPRLLLLVGAPATRCMLDQTEGINRLHGRWFEWRTAEGDLEVPALPTFHPAFLMRTPSAKSMAWSDLKTFAERLNRPSRG
ncbi:MAG: uracil-DNA glycosylase [Phenylobacterium sp.]